MLLLSVRSVKTFQVCREQDDVVKQLLIAVDVYAAMNPG